MFVLFVCSPIVAACTNEGPDRAPVATLPAHVGSESCRSCHAEQGDRWDGSHHDLAMQAATDATVRGDFNDTTFTYADIESRFFRRDGGYFVQTDGPEGELETYRIAYTFGVDPLQQYLIEFPDGRVQALSIAWDTRRSEDGGQRWFHLYPDEQVDHRDPLHWTGPAQNWNFMCAECHSTDVRKNYRAEDDRFDTAWSEIDVSCEACHGPGSAHVTWAAQDPAARDPLASGILAFPLDGAWTMNVDTGIATPQPDRPVQVLTESCARCHSRRAQLSEDYVHGSPLVDSHRPALLNEGLYFADGQIQDEVFVYGSFTQSKMYHAGVTCTDCHDAHSLTLRAPGNGLCAQCHLPTLFDTENHHLHAADSPGAMCTNCHMPNRTYMVLDERSDHSFRVPRPDVSVRTGTPDACTHCHQEQSPDWAADVLRQRFGPPDDPHYGDIIAAGRSGEQDAAAMLSVLANDTSTPPIVKATALELLGANSGSVAIDTLEGAATDESPLVRMAVADAARHLPTDARVRLLTPLLEDRAKAVRLGAAASLMNVPRASLRQSQTERLQAALAEYRSTQELHADRADAQVNLGVLERSVGDLTAAATAFARAIERNPHFVPAYVNLADAYREANREADTEAVLRRGLRMLPEEAALYHALGLSLIRSGDAQGGEAALRRAHELATENARYGYVYAIALNSRGETEQALTILRTVHERRPNDGAVLAALVTISRDQGQLAAARRYAQALLELAPNDPEVRRLAESL